MRWHCPSCKQDTVTVEHRPHTPFHACPALAGLTAPFVPAGLAAVHRVQEREDYVGSELVQVDGNGRPVSFLTTVRDDGEDCTVFAPTARVRTEIGD